MTILLVQPLDLEVVQTEPLNKWSSFFHHKDQLVHVVLYWHQHPHSPDPPLSGSVSSTLSPETGAVQETLTVVGSDPHTAVSWVGGAAAAGEY